MYEIDLLNYITYQRSVHNKKDLHEVLLLAKTTPGLVNHLPMIDDVIIWFDWAFSNYANTDEINWFWFDFVNMVLQRYAGLFDVELSAADNLVSNLFWRFFKSPLLNNIHTSYGNNAIPLVFLGRGGARSYYTLPPTLHRPLAIIHLPRAALNNVWRWNILAHETGHDIFFCVEDLSREISALTASVAYDALRLGIVKYPPVSAFLEVNGRPTQIHITEEQFVIFLWEMWANEIFADLFSVLMCGPASVFTLQEVIGFGAEGPWHLVSGPDSHPLPLLRNLLNISFLRHLGFTDYSQMLEHRLLLRTGGQLQDLRWVFNGRTEIARVNINQFIPLLDLVTSALLNTPLKSLNNHSLRQIANFSYEDQAIVDFLVNVILRGGSPSPKTEARHLVAAAQLAFVGFPGSSDLVHSRVIHMLAGLPEEFVPLLPH
ncbi:MAG: hypothetical protein ACOY46_08015 [Bacillota bacterium]